MAKQTEWYETVVISSPLIHTAPWQIAISNI